MANQSVLTVTNMNIWQKSAEQRRKNEKQESVSNMTRRGIQLKTVKENRQ